VLSEFKERNSKKHSHLFCTSKRRI